MSNLTSIPISDPKRFLALQDRYKHELMEDQHLDEASKVAARRQLLLENKHVNLDWALPQVKAMSRQLNRLTQRIRQPYGAAPPRDDVDEEDPADDFAAGPVQAMVKRFLKPAKPPTTIKKTPPNRPVRQPRVQHTPAVTPSPRRRKPPQSPLTGFELLDYADYEDTPEAVIDRSYRRLFPHGESPIGTRRASPQYALESPPSVRRQSRSPLPRTPILTTPFYEQVLTEPPPNYPFVVGPSKQTPQETSRGTKRKIRTPIPSAVRQHVKRLSASKDTGSAIAQRTRAGKKKVTHAVKKKATQTVKTKAKQTAADEGTKFLKNWLKYR